MDKFFEISKRGSTVRTEIFAGLTTFFAMAYIIVVNPNQVTGFSEGLGNVWNAVYIGSILVAVIGTRTKIPRLGFLNWLEGRCNSGNASEVRKVVS